jgi:hypothetical protein
MKPEAVSIFLLITVLFSQGGSALAQQHKNDDGSKNLPGDLSGEEIELLEKQVLQGAPDQLLTGGWKRNEIIDFINESFAKTRQKDLADLMLNYADKVDYYDQGLVDKKFVFNDKRYFFKRWEDIEYQIDDDVSIIDLPSQDAKELIFNVRYAVACRTRDSRSRGVSLTILRVRKINGEINIIGEISEVVDNRAIN